MAKIVKDDIDRLYDYDIYAPTRTIYMGSTDTDMDGGESGVDTKMTERVIKALHILDSSAPTGDKPITIIMNNIGGDYYHGLGIYDAIVACKNHVTIIAYGNCMSMGAVILQAADDRVLSKNCRFMIHYGYTSLGDNHPKVNEKWVEQFKKDRLLFEEIFMNKIQTKDPNFQQKKLKKMMDFDTILSSQETVDLGLADRIL